MEYSFEIDLFTNNFRYTFDCLLEKNQVNSYNLRN